jgi:hypothetical protein
MSKNLVEQAIVFNELYLKAVSGVEENKVSSIIKNSLGKKKDKLANKYEFPKLSSLSQEEKVKFERLCPETYAYSDPNSGIVTNFKRTIKTADGVTLVLYFDNHKDLHFMWVLLRSKKNNKITAKRLFWRLHSKKSTVAKEDVVFDVFGEDVSFLVEDTDVIEMEFDETMELVESTLFITE